MRRATGANSHGERQGQHISIHALLAESDQANAVDQILPGHISIHALLAESDPPRVVREPATSRFLSTLSLRRATESQQLSARPTTYFYPRSPCGERHEIPSKWRSGTSNFYPRSPCGERLDKRCQFNGNNGNFYPRSPCGERLDLTFH